jgi:hypothetical protein
MKDMFDLTDAEIDAISGSYDVIDPQSNMTHSIQTEGGVPALPVGTQPALKNAPAGTEGSGTQMHTPDKKKYEFKHLNKLKTKCEDTSFYGGEVGAPRV